MLISIVHCAVTVLDSVITGCTLKMLQLLQQYEHLPTHLAQAVDLIVNTYGVKGIVSEIMRYSYTLSTCQHSVSASPLKRLVM